MKTYQQIETGEVDAHEEALVSVETRRSTVAKLVGGLTATFAVAAVYNHIGVSVSPSASTLAASTTAPSETWKLRSDVQAMQKLKVRSVLLYRGVCHECTPRELSRAVPRRARDSVAWCVVDEGATPEGTQRAALPVLAPPTAALGPTLNVCSSHVCTTYERPTRPHCAAPRRNPDTIKPNQKVVYGELDSDSVRGLFTKYKGDFDRNYETDEEEENRFGIFKLNLKHIDSLNYMVSRHIHY